MRLCLPTLTFFVQRLEVRQVDQRGLERLLGQIGRPSNGAILGHERCQRAIGLLDAPAQLAPQAHEQVDPQERNCIRRVAVGIAQRGQIEIATGIRIGQHQNAIEGNGLQFGLQSALWRR